MMKKILALLMSLALLLGCAAVAEETQPKQTIGTISINGAFSLQCALPDGYQVTPVYVGPEQVIALIGSGDPTRPMMTLSVAFDETYSDVERLNDLDSDALALLEETFTSVYDSVEISYDETSYGTRLLIATNREENEDFVDFLSIYKGYFVEFIMTAGPEAENRALTDEQIEMCVRFLSELDFVPADAEAQVPLNNATFTADLGAYDEELDALQITLKTPVGFTNEQVEALKAGDTLDLHSETVAIETIEKEEEFGTYMINDEYELRQDEETGIWYAFLYDAIQLKEIAELVLPVPENMVFIDEIDHETLEILDEPAQGGKPEFVERLNAEADGSGAGFAADNVKITFGEDGEIVQIRRQYVPWQ